MRVVSINGSPRPQGNTHQALETVAEVLRAQGIEVEHHHLGGVRSCTGCYACASTRDGTCVLEDDGINHCVARIREADGLLLGAPVYYADLPGGMKGALDRIFTVCANNGGLLRHKVGAPVVVARRSGSLPAFDAMVHHLVYAEMVVPGSGSWNTAYGRAPGEVALDAEGIDALRRLGRNMAWLMQTLHQGRGTIPPPQRSKPVFTSFIR